MMYDIGRARNKEISPHSSHMTSGRYKEITEALNGAAIRCENAELRVEILEKMIAEAAALCLGVEDRLWCEYETNHPLRIQRFKYRDDVSTITDSSMMLGLIKHSVAVSNRLIDDGMNQLTGVADSINKLAAPFAERETLQEIPDLSHMSLGQLTSLKQKLGEPPIHRGHTQRLGHRDIIDDDKSSLHSRQHSASGRERSRASSEERSEQHTQSVSHYEGQIEPARPSSFKHQAQHPGHETLPREPSRRADATGKSRAPRD
jgi:hypothetical protein